MTDETDKAVISLQRAASFYRRTDPTVADDLEGTVRYKQLSPEEREEARARDPSLLTLVTRLDKRTKQAVEDYDSLLANDLQAAAELIRGL